MICDDWVNVDIDSEMNKNWKRLLVKLQHKHPIYTNINVKLLEKLKPKPKGLSTLIAESDRYISPPHPYNLRKLDRHVQKNKKSSIMYNESRLRRYN